MLAMLRLKPLSARGGSHHLAFMSKWHYYSHVFSFIHPVDKFSFEEVRS